jgi:hypothetical protein
LRDILFCIEHTGLGQTMRESGPWTYPIVNLTHILGVATLFGSILVLDLRLLGLWRRLPLHAIVGAVVPVAMTGLLVAALAGSAMLADKATAYVGNPFLYIKFPAIALGVLNAIAIRLTPAWQQIGKRNLSRREERQLAVFGGVSIVCWVTAISMGRMIAYW